LYGGYVEVEFYDVCVLVLNDFGWFDGFFEC